LKILFFLFYKTSYYNEEVNCTEPFPSVSIPWKNKFLPLSLGQTWVGTSQW
jgi:hypothetical protein